MRIQVKQSWKDKIYNPVKVTKILRSILFEESEIDRDKEHFWVFGLTNSNVIKYIDLVSLGTLDRTMCEPREVFRLAVMKGVKAIIIAHNHPSGVMRSPPLCGAPLGVLSDPRVAGARVESRRWQLHITLVERDSSAAKLIQESEQAVVNAKSSRTLRGRL